MKKIVIMIIAMAGFAFGGELENAYGKIPDIMKDHSLVVETIWGLDKTNRVVFIRTMNNAIEAYPCADDEKNEIRSKFKRLYYIATNSVAPTVELQVPWSRQLEQQHRMNLQNVNVRSDFETRDWQRDASNPNGIEIITTPFSPRPFGEKQITLEPSCYPGQL